MARKRRWSWISSAAAAAAPLALAAAGAGAAAIDNLGALDSTLYPPSISGNGAAVTWRAPGCDASLWTEAGGVSSLGGLTGASGCTAPDALSRDGAVVVGSSANGSWPNHEAIRWEGSMVGLGDLRVPGHFSRATDVSSDGERIAGWGTSPISTGAKLPFLWTQGTGLVSISGFSGGLDLLLDAGGTVVAGQSGGVAAYTSCPSPSTCASATSIGDLPGGAASSEPAAVAQVLQQLVVAGTGTDASGAMAFRWTPARGFEPLGKLGSTSAARDMTPDGRLIVGTSGNRAFVWDASHGMRDLQDLLESDFGLDLTAWSLVAATGVSDDGSHFTGFGAGPGSGTRVWRVTLDEPLLPPLAVPTAGPLGLGTLATLLALGGIGAAVASRRSSRR